MLSSKLQRKLRKIRELGRLPLEADTESSRSEGCALLRLLDDVSQLVCQKFL